MFRNSFISFVLKVKWLSKINGAMSWSTKANINGCLLIKDRTIWATKNKNEYNLLKHIHKNTKNERALNDKWGKEGQEGPKGRSERKRERKQEQEREKSPGASQPHWMPLEVSGALTP